MSSEAGNTASTNSGLASSILYVAEISILLDRVRRIILASAITSTVLMVISILIFGGFSERLERLVPLHEEFIGAVITVLVIVPISLYLTFRATSTMRKWRDRLDSFSYALRFESHRPEGESPSVRLANQAFNALIDRQAERGFDPHEYANRRTDSETFDVLIPGQITKALSGHKGAIVARRVESKPVLAKDLSETVQKIRGLHMRLWRLLIVSDKEFPIETIDYHSSLSKRQVGFSIDLIEETQSGFSVVSLGG